MFISEQLKVIILKYKYSFQKTEQNYRKIPIFALRFLLISVMKQVEGGISINGVLKYCLSSLKLSNF